MMCGAAQRAAGTPPPQAQPALPRLSPSWLCPWAQLTRGAAEQPHQARRELRQSGAGPCLGLSPAPLGPERPPGGRQSKATLTFPALKTSLH